MSLLKNIRYTVKNYSHGEYIHQQQDLENNN